MTYIVASSSTTLRIFLIDMYLPSNLRIFFMFRNVHTFSGVYYFTTVSVVMIPPSGIYSKSNEALIWRGINITSSQRFPK